MNKGIFLCSSTTEKNGREYVYEETQLLAFPKGWDEMHVLNSPTPLQQVLN